MGVRGHGVPQDQTEMSSRTTAAPRHVARRETDDGTTEDRSRLNGVRPNTGHAERHGMTEGHAVRGDNGGDGMTRAVGTPSGAGDTGAKGRGTKHTGLRIERVWTTEGVHPYDEVTWERRDVVMTNWRDGSVNFEQRGVEFPDFWSINATNIVTTKYFRGAVGTPQRESSLRQLIDRVVRTYRRAGEEYGYFASERDA